MTLSELYHVPRLNVPVLGPNRQQSCAELRGAEAGWAVVVKPTAGTSLL